MKFFINRKQKYLVVEREDGAAVLLRPLGSPEASAWAGKLPRIQERHGDELVGTERIFRVEFGGYARNVRALPWAGPVPSSARAYWTPLDYTAAVRLLLLVGASWNMPEANTSSRWRAALAGFQELVTVADAARPVLAAYLAGAGALLEELGALFNQSGDSKDRRG